MILTFICTTIFNINSTCRTVGISARCNFYWLKEVEVLSRFQVSELKLLKKESERLKKIVADLQLIKLIPKESLDNLKSKA